MIFKVYYQAEQKEMPVRENTQTLYIEAANEREVRRLLKERPINIELVQVLEGAHLEYEKNSPQFKLQENHSS
ncbi:DNA-directed RNA polymerase subunit epsilon [Lederbergia sp. NSJ-179]|uniref:DNA-dependent RNA polymerase subunit epsilon n=1 Tax=Lederbergia sp. NSJ-179 TaxID=2931402 RepID=UPI001FD0F874|nr:DNA-directed RNA polymerase subunit epsilon [Lederbergia sp. NSJ-179]MCJ7841687.1 DNA-directed RNA polymerase subunit epsilon [Lederbergia sp. NSJ-179]